MHLTCKDGSRQDARDAGERLSNPPVGLSCSFRVAACTGKRVVRPRQAAGVRQLAIMTPPRKDLEPRPVGNAPISSSEQKCERFNESKSNKVSWPSRLARLP